MDKLYYFIDAEFREGRHIKTTLLHFDVLLTVHLSIIFVINQLNVQILVL